MEIIGLRLPLIEKGDNLVQLALESLSEESRSLEDGDILVFTEKIVAKSQGRMVDLASVSPSAEALRTAETVDKDPRLVELILRESNRVLKIGQNFIVTETKDGFVCANAGIDSSNVEEGHVKLLPRDPDETAEMLRREVQETTGKMVGIVIADSFGRPFRSGSVGVAIGVAGMTALWDRRGEKDIFGRPLQTTRVAVADCIASAANLVTGDAAEKTPVALIRGLNILGEGRGINLLRKSELDLFRK